MIEHENITNSLAHTKWNCMTAKSVTGDGDYIYIVIIFHAAEYIRICAAGSYDEAAAHIFMQEDAEWKNLTYIRIFGSARAEIYISESWDP